MLIVTALFGCIGCGRESVQRFPDPTLASIDSLLWSQPDSAFVQLQAFAEGREVDSLDTFNRHYFHLLLSELLYKNDYAQTNRDELLQAVDYYDSIVTASGNLIHPDLVFLDARSHYIDGVGYYEMDSAVPACEQYLKAVELMEDRFNEEELVGKKAQLMAMTYTHLCGLFSDQYLHEQAIHYGKQSLAYFERYDATPWHVSWMLDEIGMQYDMMKQWDSAYYYYQKAYHNLPDTTGQSFRDTKTHLLMLSSKKGLMETQDVLFQLHSLLSSAESEKEYCSRCLTIGGVFYRERQFDSAWLYLNEVFNGVSNIGAKKQAAEWLVQICKESGKNEESVPYADFVVPFATQEEKNSAVKTQLTVLYSTYVENRQASSRQHDTKRRIQRLALEVLPLALLLSLFIAFYHRKRRHRRDAEQQITETSLKALGGRLRNSNAALETAKKENEKLQRDLKVQQDQKKWSSLDGFLNDSICQEIMELLEKEYVKRDLNIEDYPNLWLDDVQLSRLTVAVEQHFHGFCEMLSEKYPKINSNEIHQCLLCLLNLKDTQIAALLHFDYSTIKKRSAKLKKAFGTDKSLQVFFRELILK